MQVERPSTFDGIDTTHIVAPPSPLPPPPPPQQQQQQPQQQQQQRHSITINSRGDEAPAESLSRFDSTNSEDDTHSARTADSTVDPNRKSLEVTARRRRSHQRQPKSPGTGKDQSSRPGSVLIDDDSTSSKGQSSRECQRVPSWRSGSKRAARLRQGEKTSSQQPSLSSSSSHYSLEDDCESLRVTLPLRVTTGVTMTAASGSTTTTKTIITTASPKVHSQGGGGIAAGTLLNLTGSAGEQDVVVVRGLQSPGWKKRAKVQNGSGEALSTAAEVADESGEENGDAEGDDASDEMTDLRGDGHPATAASGITNPGSRRGSQTLHHYYHGNHHHHGRAAQPSSPGATTRGSHQTHTRNFSSPSLLDSFTSPEPMLSPIQSYFGSDPNSPASSFSLPRHDHYSRLTIDPAASMDGYHGFATHPWSEQSTTPSRAFSHRWTRRLSQSDAFAVAR